MTTPNATPRTAVATRVAADGNSVTFEQMERMASAVAKSGLFGVKTADQALALMLVAQAEGRSPAVAAQEYHIIQGRPALKADTLLARYQQAGGTVKFEELSEKRCAATFSHPASGSFTIDWTLEMAQRAGLASKDNWKAYPRAMLRARVISEGVRTSFPGVAIGVYTPEEIRDGAVEVDITPVPQADAVRGAVQAAAESATALTDAERQEHFNAIDNAADQAALAAAFAAAWKHAKEAHDTGAQSAFKTVYDARKADLTKEGQL